MSKGTIELNGRRYDVATGRPMSGIQTNVRANPVNQPASPRRSIDGFSAPNTSLNRRPQPAPKPSSSTLTSPHQAAKAMARHQQQRAQTLIRTGVKRPDVRQKTAIKPQYTTDMIAQPVSKIVPKRSYYNTDPHKISHAERVARSQKIQHFSDFAAIKSTPEVAAKANDTANIRSAGASGYSQPALATRGQHVASIAERQRASASTNHLPAKTVDDDQSIFDQVLASAKAHEQKPLKRTRKQAAKAHRRAIGITASIMVVVLLGAFIAYQNRASINLQLASAKAGFQASTPSVKPDGYALKNISASPGMINISYKSPVGSKILIGQKESNWDSQTLQQNYLAMSDQKYQTYHESGKTIFTYGHNQATWVDGGIWYQIQGNASTSGQELVDIAASM